MESQTQKIHRKNKLDIQELATWSGGQWRGDYSKQIDGFGFLKDHFYPAVKELDELAIAKGSVLYWLEFQDGAKKQLKKVLDAWEDYIIEKQKTAEDYVPFWTFSQWIMDNAPGNLDYLEIHDVLARWQEHIGQYGAEK